MSEQKVDQKNKATTCEWVFKTGEGYKDHYQTQCRVHHTFYAPSNSTRYCCFCGKKIKEVSG